MGSRWLKMGGCLLAAWLAGVGVAAAGGLDAAHQARMTNDYDTAVTLYQQADPTPDALFWLATVHRWRGELTAATQTFARLLDDYPDHMDALLGDARVALAAGRPTRAERRLKRVLTLAPNHIEARRLLLTAYLHQHRLKDAYRLADTEFSGSERLRRMADVAMARRRYRQASRVYEELVSLHPRHLGYRLDLGRAYEKMGYHREALQLYEESLDRFPNSSRLHRRLATAYRAVHRRDDAAYHLERVLKRHGNDADALLGRALIEMDRDNLSRTNGLIEPLAGATEAVAEPTPIVPVEPVEPVEPVVAVKVVVPVAAAVASVPQAKQAEVALLTHRVVRGDTMGSISKHYLGAAHRWREIWRANPSLFNPNILEVGQLLNVPVTGQQWHRVARGETLGVIAKHYLGDAGRWREIWRANPSLDSPDRIEVGQQLAIPQYGQPIAQTVVVAVAPIVVPAVVAAPVATQVVTAQPTPVTSDIAAKNHKNTPKNKHITDIEGERFGAAEWLGDLLALDPQHRDGRAALARLRYRQMRFAESEQMFADLHRQYPQTCAYCRGWMDAHEAQKPVLDAGFRYSLSDDLDGRSDRTTIPVPVRYRTFGWHLNGRQRVVPWLTLGARLSSTDTALTDRRSGASIYDFNTQTGWLSATAHLADRHTVSLAVGVSDYSPNDGVSIADRRFGRLNLRWDRVTHRNDWHVGLSQGPYLGRGVVQGAFGLFRERRLTVAGGAALSHRSWLYGDVAQMGYSDGHNLTDMRVGLRLRLDTHRLDISLARGHRLGRFLDEASPKLRLVFVPYRELMVKDRWRRPFPFRFSGAAWLRDYSANQFSLVSSPIPRLSPANRELGITLETTYAHPALAPFSFGGVLDAVRFKHDAEAYNTLNGYGPSLFVQIADKQPRCWSYLLRYQWGVRWDEDPANDHYFQQSLRGELSRTLGRHLSVSGSATYRSASAFDERGVKALGNLVWRF